MSIALILQYATLLWILISGVGVAVAFLSYRGQVKTQIFLAVSARYDELLHSSSAHVWGSIPHDDARLTQHSDELTISALRFCTLVSLTYFLFLDRRIPREMWHLMLRSAERRMCTPWFVREWKQLRSEFESFPEFVELVTSVQCGTHKWKR